MSTMITGERRGVRRGMTVLGKVPAVPRPINLPSQRLENRGLDPNVEIVPRGTVTWGNAARSPPTANSNWGGSGSQPSSPPVSAGAWGKPAPAWGTNSARPSSAGSTRPASGGSTSSGAPRPSSSGGRHPQDLPRPSSAGNQDLPPQNAWGPPNSRPQSASGPQASNTQPAGGRPRSAEPGPNGRVSLLSSELSHGPQAHPWGPGGARKQPEDGPQPSRFTLSNGDFPSLGSDKNPNLRPQQRERSENADEERPPTAHGESYPYDDGYPQGSRFNEADANVWHGGPAHFRPPMEGGYGMPSNSWRREPHDRPEGEDHWPNGPYGPPRFPNPEFLPQRFGPGPGSYGRGQPGDGYGHPPFMRPMNPERPQFGPGMFPGPYEGYYGYPGYNMDERDMMMWPAGPGYGFHPDFPRHPMGPRPRHMPNHPEGFHPEYRPPGKMKEGEPRPDGHPEFRREPANKHTANEPKRSMLPRPHGQKDWGNDEPMDFSRPVFEKEPTPTKNHKVSFKAEPTVADVAILKKPKPNEETGDAFRTEEESKPDVASSGQTNVSADKDAAETTAGVLGKAPLLVSVPENDKQVVNRSSADQSSKDVFKPKPKLLVHDSEKEWRPKPHGDSSKSQDGENDADYDYEAQRAKMKEIAAQRARQLQREEEERTKEQKAKALAKLEELNRRSATVSADSPALVVQEESALKVIDHTEMQFGTYQSGDLTQEVKIISVPHPGKRNDRKGNRSREERAKVQQKKEMPATHGPDSNVDSQPSPSSAPVQEESKDVQPLPQPQTQHRQPRQRGGQRAKAKQLGKLEVEKLDASAEQFAPMETAPLDSDSPTPAATEVTTPGNGPNSHRRKKSNRSKNRHKNEVVQNQAPASLEKSSSGEIHETTEGFKVSGEKVGVEASSHSEGGESITVDVADALSEDKTAPKGNTRRFQRRFSSKRTKPQDVRVGDKTHAPEGLRWTPVRGPRNDVSPDSNGEKNEAPGHQPKSRRAEMARYTPKPVQQQGQTPNTEDNNEHTQGRRFEGQGSETFHKPGRSWRQRGGENQGFRNHEKRENGLIYQQKSGGRDNGQDVGVSSSESHHRPPYRQSSDTHHKTQYQPKNDWSAKTEQGNSSQWTSATEGKDFRGRDSGHPRRGRFGGRGGGGRSVVDIGARVEKPRMVIDATGGAVPSQVVG